MNRTNGTMNQAWTLSDVGNWDAFTSAGSTWNRTHSNAHEFTGFTGASTGTLTYDVKGNQTSRPSTLSAPALNLDWNFDNQLVGADTNGSAGSLEVTFEYDALGRRVSRSHSSGNVVYVHAGQQVIADYARGTAAASPSYRYVYADYVDEPILRHSGTGTTLPTTGDNALYFHRNQQYSIIGLTNAAGTLVERYSYTAYGTLGIYDPSGTVRTTSTYANRYTYTGREYDPDLNLYHFRARWYDPSTGGFISRDPLGYVDGMSLYRGYFGVKHWDPTGQNIPGTFDAKVIECSPESKNEKAGCCTHIDIFYYPTAAQKVKYSKIYLKQWAWSRATFKGTCFIKHEGDLFPSFKSVWVDPWHWDELVKIVPWVSGIPRIDPEKDIKESVRHAHLWDEPGAISYIRVCGGPCAFKEFRQDFETCAIGVLPSGKEENLGCMFWGHSCNNFSYWTELVERITVCNGFGPEFVDRYDCKGTSDVDRYPKKTTTGILPQPQKPDTWDPKFDPPTD